MGFLNTNIRFLRKNKGLTQEDLAKKIGITRPIVGAYEEGRADPKLHTLQNIAHYFEVGIDDLLNKDLSKKKGDNIKADIEGIGLRVLPVIVNPDNKELITVVPIKAAAGYLNGYSDSEYVEKLHHFDLPLNEISSNKTYRIFQIKGDSMKPIMPGSYIIAEYLENWKEVKDNKCYVLLTKDEGIVYKRILNRISESNEFILKSDNPEYPAYQIDINTIFEVWKAIGYISFELPDAEDLSLDKLSSLVMGLQKDLNKLKTSKK
jgi:transcriptional regulator with XRE-family HTH domain